MKKKVKVKVLTGAAGKCPKGSSLLVCPPVMSEADDDPTIALLNKRIAWLANELSQAKLKKAERQLEIKRAKEQSRKVNRP